MRYRPLVLRLLSYVCILAIALSFTLLYSRTFRGHPIHLWTHGPFNFECGVYRTFARGGYNIYETNDNKLPKHFLCAVSYPLIHRALTRYFPREDSPLVCSALTGFMIALFGCWLYGRTRGSFIVFPVMLLLGFSFTTWYVGSVWESRSFIALGAVVLLISLDRLLRRPSLFSLVLSVAALIFSLLITIGNIYLLPLIPLTLLARVKKTGLKKVAARSVLSLLSIVLIIALIYQISGLRVNPNLRLHKLLELSRHEREHINASLQRFNLLNYASVALQSLVYSVGGLHLISACGGSFEVELWGSSEAYPAYFQDFRGIFFLAGYAALVLVMLFAIFRKSLWRKEPLLMVIVFWMLLYISFFVYFNPYAGPVYAAELQPLFWAFVALALRSLPRRKITILLGLLLIFIVLNNWSVLSFFRDFYGGKHREFFTFATHRSRGRYNLLVWGLKPGRKTGDKVLVEIAHAVPGERGGFRIVAYADKDGDGKPETEIAGSKYFIARSPGQWSSYTFNIKEERIFVGFAWPEGSDTLIFRGRGDWPRPDWPLEGRFYWEITPSRQRSAGPDFTNLKISFPD